MKAFATGASSNRKWIEVQPQIDEFKKFCLIDQRKSKNTAYKHCREMKHFFNWVGNKSISVNLIRDYLVTLEGKSSSTYKNCLSAFKVYFRDFLGYEWLVKSFRFPAKEYKTPNIPSKEELQKFYNALEDRRDKAMFLLYATSGLRRNELLYLRKKDLDFSKGMIIPRKNSKTKRTWITFYNFEAEKELQRYLKTRNELAS